MAAVLGKVPYLSDKVLNLLRATSITAPGTVYLAAFTTMPLDDGTGAVEVSGNAYARQPLTFGAPSTVSGGEGRQTVTTADAIFPIATPSNWGTIIGIGVYDNLTTGNLMYAGLLDASQVINAGNQLSFAAGALAIEEH